MAELNEKHGKKIGKSQRLMAGKGSG